MSVERIDIQIREDGSRVVRRNIEGIGSSSDMASRSVDLLKRALGLLGAALAIDKVKQYADAWSSATGLINVATKSHEEALAVQDKLFAAAQRTRTSFTDMAELYARAARAGADLGASQNQVIQFTEGVGRALVIQHTSATQASGALLQLGQLLGMGKVRAQEFNSIIEQTPVILQTVANNIEGANGSISGLRRLMNDGQLSSRQFFEAFLKGSEDLKTDFEKSSATIAQGFTVIGNAVMKYIGELDHSIGGSKAFGKMAKWIADNIDLVATSLLALGAAVAVAFAPAAIMAFAGALMRLGLIIAANPFMALAAAIAAATVYLVQFKDEINAGIDDVTSLGDVFRALGEQISAGLGMAGELFSSLWKVVVGVYESITRTTDEATKDWQAKYEGFYDGVGTGFAGVVRSIARTVDAIAGLLTGMGIAIIRTFAGLPEAISTPFKKMYNVAADWIEKIVNTTIDGINAVRSVVGTQLIETIKIERANVTEDYYRKYGQDIAASIQDGFEMQGGFAEKWVNGVFDRAAQIAKARAAAEAAKGPGANLDNPIGDPRVNNIVDPKEEKEVEKLKRALTSLLNEIAPLEGAKRELAAAEELLHAARAKGIIDAEQEARYLTLLKAHYVDILDPLGKLNREIEEQMKLLGMSAQAREVEAQVLAATKDLLAQGVILTQEETQALRDKLTALQQATIATQAYDDVIANTVGQRQQYIDQLNAIQQALANGDITKGDATSQLAQMMPDLFEGTQEAIDMQLERFQYMYEQIDMMRQKDLISETTAAQMRAKVEAQNHQMRLAGAQQFFGNLSSLMQTSNKKLFKVGQAAALAQATIDGYVAVQKAYTSAPYPYNIALAAAQAAASAVQIANIAGAQPGFQTGGEFKVGGTGGADSQMVAFRATPGEKVAISTPQQQRKGDPNRNGSAAPTVEFKPQIINVRDPKEIPQAIESDEGTQSIINVISNNANIIREMLKG